MLFNSCMRSLEMDCIVLFVSLAPFSSLLCFSRVGGKDDAK